LALLTRGRPKTRESLTRQILHRCRFVGSAQLKGMLQAYVHENLKSVEALELFQHEILEKIDAHILETYLVGKESPDASLDTASERQLKAFARAYTEGSGNNPQTTSSKPGQTKM